MTANAQHLITPLYFQAYLSDNLTDLAQIYQPDINRSIARLDHLAPACHTGRRSCFYNAVRDNWVKVISTL